MKFLCNQMQICYFLQAYTWLPAAGARKRSKFKGFQQRYEGQEIHCQISILPVICCVT